MVKAFDCFIRLALALVPFTEDDYLHRNLPWITEIERMLIQQNSYISLYVWLYS